MRNHPDDQHPTDPLPSSGDDWMEDLLRRDAAVSAQGYVADEGFTARVMANLPPPATLPAWRRPALAALWASAGIGMAAALPSAVMDATHELLRLVAGQRFTLAQAGIAILALAAASWAGTLYTLRED